MTTPSLFDTAAEPRAEPRAHARRTDPETSHAAAARVRDLTGKQVHILLLFRSLGPMCDEQLIARVKKANQHPMTDSSVRTRRRELVDLGLVRVKRAANGEPVKVKLPVTGNESRVWEAVPKEDLES